MSGVDQNIKRVPDALLIWLTLSVDSRATPLFLFCPSAKSGPLGLKFISVIVKNGENILQI